MAALEQIAQQSDNNTSYTCHTTVLILLTLVPLTGNNCSNCYLNKTTWSSYITLVNEKQHHIISHSPSPFRIKIHYHIANNDYNYYSKLKNASNSSKDEI